MNTPDSQTTSTRRRSPAVLFLASVLLLSVGFVLGTRASTLQTYVAPIFGVKVSSDTIDLSSVQKTYQYLAANFDGNIDKQALIDGANHGLVTAAGDKYTVYLTAKEAEEFNNDLSGNVGAGIGAEIGVRNDQPTITRILPDNPAGQAGLLQGDTIVAINGESAVGWTSDKAATAIRGDEGTSVKLTIDRSGTKKDFTITRRTINNPSVTSRIDGTVGILTISRFDSATGALARKSAEDLVRQGAKSIILDLRSDGGGYIDAAVDVAGLWLQNKTVVTQQTNGKVIDTRKTKDDAPFNGLKTAILINGGSASASEILSSALKDNGAATLVGEQSFGKGSVQEVLDLNNGGALLKVTVAKWYTPNGVNVGGKGLTPDIKVGISDADINAGRDPQLDAAKKYVQ